MKTIKREHYLARLRALKDQNLIKVITGVRRSGKSTLLKLYRDELLASGAPSYRIQSINFEDPEFSYDVSWHDIYTKLDQNLANGGMNYVFLDEVQYIDDFEHLLVGLQTKPNVDLYVTGSNAHLLSSDLATLLSGRSIEISILPLSFKEYLEIFDDHVVPIDQRFSDYLSFGGFPQAATIFERDKSSITSYLTGIYETIVGRDILDRGVVNDKPAVNAITRFLLDNLGNSTSSNTIATTLGVSRQKAVQILDALAASFLFYPLERFDIKGKEILKTQSKYYTVDLGLRWALLGRDRSEDMGHILENLVFLELHRRGHKISVGKIADKEIDFVTRDPSGYTSYYQVAWSVHDEATLERELAPLRRVNDYAPRYLITMDPEEISHSGIRQQNVISWLLNDNNPGLNP